MVGEVPILLSLTGEFLTLLGVVIVKYEATRKKAIQFLDG